MIEAEIIKKLQGLKEIKPNRNWVSLTKSQILGVEKPTLNPFLIFKPAYAGLVVVFILFGVFGVAQSSLPGDLLFPIKKITEKGRAVFISEAEKPNFQLKLTSERLDDLSKIAQANQVERLSFALKEFSATKAEAEKEVSNSIKNKSEEEAVKIAKKVALEIKEINEKEGEVLASLGLEPTKEGAGESTAKTIVGILINDAAHSSLTEEQEDDLAKIIEYYENNNYQGALELYLTGSLNQ